MEKISTGLRNTSWNLILGLPLGIFFIFCLVLVGVSFYREVFPTHEQVQQQCLTRAHNAHRRCSEKLFTRQQSCDGVLRQDITLCSTSK